MESAARSQIGNAACGDFERYCRGRRKRGCLDRPIPCRASRGWLYVDKIIHTAAYSRVCWWCMAALATVVVGGASWLASGEPPLIVRIVQVVWGAA